MKGVCEQCRWWLRGHRADGKDSYRWTHTMTDGRTENPFGDCRINPPPSNDFPRTHQGDWCGKFEESGNE